MVKRILLWCGSWTGGSGSVLTNRVLYQMSQVKGWEECPGSRSAVRVLTAGHQLSPRCYLCGKDTPGSAHDKTPRQPFRFQQHKKHQEQDGTAGVAPGTCCWRSLWFLCLSVTMGHSAPCTAPGLPWSLCFLKFCLKVPNDSLGVVRISASLPRCSPPVRTAVSVALGPS